MTIHISLPDIMGIDIPKEPIMNNDQDALDQWGGRTPNDIRADQGMAAEPAREMPPVERNLISLGRSIQELAERLGHHEERISFALSPDDTDPATAEVQKRPGQSNLAHQLQDLDESVKHMIYRVNVLTRRVEF